MEDKEKEKMEINRIASAIIDSDSAFNNFMNQAEDEIQLVAMYNSFTVAAINCQYEAKDKIMQAEVNHQKAMRIVQKLEKLGVKSIKGESYASNNIN